MAHCCVHGLSVVCGLLSVRNRYIVVKFCVLSENCVKLQKVANCNHYTVVQIK